MNSAGDWIRDFYERAHREGDEPRMRLLDFYTRAIDIGYERPDERLAHYEAGRIAARQLGEPWWEMFFEHWKIETLLFAKQDARGALDLAARAVAEVAKPRYAGLPERASLNLNLVSAYIHLDPIGHDAKIRAAFGYIEGHCIMFREFVPYHAQQWAAFLEAVSDAGAVEAAWQHLRLAEESDSDHYRMGAFLLLCKVLVQDEPALARVLLGELARAAEDYARSEGRERAIASALMWRALAARYQNDEDAAQSLYGRAWNLQNRMTTPRNAVNFAALTFHRERQEWDDALRVCQAELRVLRAHKLTFLEAKRRLQKCELLQQSGRDWQKEARRLRAAAARLPSQKHWETKLDELG